MNTNEMNSNAIEVIKVIIKAAGGEFNGKVRLYKAFYFAHLYYWQDFHRMLTDYPIVKMPQGPGIDAADELIAEMVRQGELQVSYQNNGPYKENVYKLTKPFQINPNDEKYQAVEKAVKFIQDKSARDLSDLTHENSRSWINAEDGEELNIYLDVLTDEEYSRLKSNIDEAERLVWEAFA
jgi:hypothetical protein